jgi:hypothetical protein
VNIRMSMNMSWLATIFSRLRVGFICRQRQNVGGEAPAVIVQLDFVIGVHNMENGGVGRCDKNKV